jgi:hypothetical protein
MVSKAAIRQMIKSSNLANSELKGTVFTNTNTATPAAGAFQFITQGIIQGDAVNQRTGSQINLVKLRVKINTIAVGVTGITRYVLYQDTQANGATPLVTDILDSAASISVTNQLTVITQKRYHIIDDFTHAVPIGGEAVKVHDKIYTNFTKKVTYLGNTSATASNGRNSIYLLYIGAATNVWDYSFHPMYLDH